MPKSFQPVSGFDLPRFAGVPTFMRLPHVPLDDEDRVAYQSAAYQNNFGKGTGDKKGIIQDSGNLSKTDVLNYQVMFSEAISNQSS